MVVKSGYFLSLSHCERHKKSLAVGMASSGASRQRTAAFSSAVSAAAGVVGRRRATKPIFPLLSASPYMLDSESAK